MLSHPTQRSLRFLPAVAIFILAIALAGAVPGYLYGSWPWSALPQPATLPQLKQIQQEGITLPGWQTLEQRTIEIGGKEWSAQAIRPQASSPVDSLELPPALLLLRPQTWHRDQPQVDWMDIDGSQHWTADSRQTLRFTVVSSDAGTGEATAHTSSVQVTARFFRGWTEAQTYAVLQWYALPTGGSPAPANWFWADQWSQWRDRQRTPWIAVSLLLPIEPLGNIETVAPTIEQLGQALQSHLMAIALSPS